MAKLFRVYKNDEFYAETDDLSDMYKEVYEDDTFDSPEFVDNTWEFPNNVYRLEAIKEDSLYDIMPLNLIEIACFDGLEWAASTDLDYLKSLHKPYEVGFLQWAAYRIIRKLVTWYEYEDLTCKQKAEFLEVTLPLEVLLEWIEDGGGKL